MVDDEESDNGTRQADVQQRQRTSAPITSMTTSLTIDIDEASVDNIVNSDVSDGDGGDDHVPFLLCSCS